MHYSRAITIMPIMMVLYVTTNMMIMLTMVRYVAFGRRKREASLGGIAFDSPYEACLEALLTVKFKTSV